MHIGEDEYQKLQLSMHILQGICNFKERHQFSKKLGNGHISQYTRAFETESRAQIRINLSDKV